MKRVLGLDYGERRIGVAVSDPLRILARRLTTIDRTSDSLEDAAAEVARLCEEQDADTVIIGCPMRTDGRFSEMEAQVEKFADAVRESTGCQVELFDERYTSILASRVVRETSGAVVATVLGALTEIESVIKSRKTKRWSIVSPPKSSCKTGLMFSAGNR